MPSGRIQETSRRIPHQRTRFRGPGLRRPRRTIHEMHTIDDGHWVDLRPLPKPEPSPLFPRQLSAEFVFKMANRMPTGDDGKKLKGRSCCLRRGRAGQPRSSQEVSESSLGREDEGRSRGRTYRRHASTTVDDWEMTSQPLYQAQKRSNERTQKSGVQSPLHWLSPRWRFFCPQGRLAVDAHRLKTVRAPSANLCMIEGNFV